MQHNPCFLIPNQNRAQILRREILSLTNAIISAEVSWDQYITTSPASYDALLPLTYLSRISYYKFRLMRCISSVYISVCDH